MEEMTVGAAYAVLAVLWGHTLADGELEVGRVVGGLVDADGTGADDTDDATDPLEGLIGAKADGTDAEADATDAEADGTDAEGTEDAVVGLLDVGTDEIEDTADGAVATEDGDVWVLKVVPGTEAVTEPEVGEAAALLTVGDVELMGEELETTTTGPIGVEEGGTLTELGGGMDEELEKRVGVLMMEEEGGMVKVIMAVPVDWACTTHSPEGEQQVKMVRKPEVS
ncbi:MAG: hypothetical protein M1829_003154 [Trizodia sp. TS-e1964]|nr:MAG: hypothetical protein M1829_003154 [Trizodia sp. TS-e1964]